jgi:hypothetical protein
MRFLIIAGLVVLSGMAAAAVPSQQALFVQTLSAKKNRYVTDGVFTGGKAGTGATVLGVRRTFSAKAQIERVIVDLGNKDGKADQSQTGYFQVSMDAGNNRVVLDLTQLKMAKVTEQQLKSVFKKSAYVSATEFTLDPEDKTGSMVFRLKRPMKLEVFQLRTPGKPSRVVLDLTPLKAKR